MKINPDIMKNLNSFEQQFYKWTVEVINEKEVVKPTKKFTGEKIK